MHQELDDERSAEIPRRIQAYDRGEVTAIPAQEVFAKAHSYLLERLPHNYVSATNDEAAWVAEAIRRRDEVKSGKISLLSGDEVVAGIKAKLSKP